MRRRAYLWPVLLMATLGSGARCPAAEPQGPYRKLLDYRYGDSREFLDEITRAIAEARGDTTKLLAIEHNLIPVLEAPDAALAGKEFACRKLWTIGTKASVPVLAGMLVDEKTSDMARFALCRNRDPSVDRVLRDALAVAKGQALIGLIHVIGDRGDREAVPELGKIAGGPDVAPSAAAIKALGAIGGPDAHQALQSLDKDAKPAVAIALLECADRFLAEGGNGKAATIYEEMVGNGAWPNATRTAALRGLAAADRAKAVAVVEEILSGNDQAMREGAMSLIRLLPAETVMQRFAPQFDRLPVRDQLRVLPALAASRDAGVVPLMVKAAGQKDGDVRLAALRALGGAPGSGETIMFLAGAAAKEDLLWQRAARESLVRLRGAGVEEAMAAGMENADGAVRVELIRALRDRRAAGAAVDLLKVSADGEKDVRSAALEALAVLAEPKHAPALVSLLVQAEDERLASEAGRAVVTALGKIENLEERAKPLIDAMAGAGPTTRAAILACLSHLGGERALVTVRAAVRDGDLSVARAAVRALADWPDATALGHLQEIAAHTEDPAWRVLALRGCLRLLALPAERTADRTQALYAEMMKLADQPAERKLVLSALAKWGQPGAIQLVQPMLKQDEVKREAALALIQIARGLGPGHREQAEAALRAVQQTITDRKLLEQVEAVLKSLESAP